jgi:hypothetical protein
MIGEDGVAGEEMIYLLVDGGTDPNLALDNQTLAGGHMILQSGTGAGEGQVLMMLPEGDELESQLPPLTTTIGLENEDDGEEMSKYDHKDDERSEDDAEEIIEKNVEKEYEVEVENEEDADELSEDSPESPPLAPVPSEALSHCSLCFTFFPTSELAAHTTACLPTPTVLHCTVGAVQSRVQELRLAGITDCRLIDGVREVTEGEDSLTAVNEKEVTGKGEDEAKPAQHIVELTAEAQGGKSIKCQASSRISLVPPSPDTPADLTSLPFSTTVFFIPAAEDCRVQQGKKLLCSLCKKDFITRNDLDSHVKTDHRWPAESWECAHCNVKCASSKALQGHTKTEHRFKCKQAKCKLVFAVEEMLDYHMQSVHMYKCGKCPSIFEHKLLLEKHIKSSHHFKCDSCPEVCDSPTELAEHGEARHGGCETCENEFSWPEAGHTCYYTRHHL